MTKTTCDYHRIEGYHWIEGDMVCRGCGLAPEVHETFDETAARKKREASRA